MNMCPSCGGIIGRDCFNPVECAQISEMQAQQHDQDHFTQGYNEGYHKGMNDPELLMKLQELQAKADAFDKLKELVDDSDVEICEAFGKYTIEIYTEATLIDAINSAHSSLIK